VTVQTLGTYDALATFGRLRAAGVLGSHSYLHVHSGTAEIGWAPVARLALFEDGAPCPDWRARVAAFADDAGRGGRTAFGYIAFDAIDAGARPRTLPDGSPTRRPLVELIAAGERLVFAPSGVTHASTRGFDAAPYLAAEPLALAPPLADALARSAAATPRDAYVSAVRGALPLLADQALDKIVLSRFEAFDVDYDPVALFAALCRPRSCVDAFLVCFGDLTAVIASPEVLLAVDAGQLVANPLAGTRPRGSTAAEDERLRDELRRDHKEVVEHVLAVKTTLDELAPHCAPGALAVRRLLDIHILERVQHLSSVIEGRLAPGRDAFDALWSMFPGVTVGGAPRDAVVPWIRRLESTSRGLYSGVVGTASDRHNCRFAIAIRGAYRYGARTFLHAGAGIVAESVPESELVATDHQRRARRSALAAVAR
jgi:salicylate synthetase